MQEKGVAACVLDLFCNCLLSLPICKQGKKVRDCKRAGKEPAIWDRVQQLMIQSLVAELYSEVVAHAIWLAFISLSNNIPLDLCLAYVSETLLSQPLLLTKNTFNPLPLYSFIDYNWDLHSG